MLAAAHHFGTNTVLLLYILHVCSCIHLPVHTKPVVCHKRKHRKNNQNLAQYGVEKVPAEAGALPHESLNHAGNKIGKSRVPLFCGLSQPLSVMIAQMFDCLEMAAAQNGVCKTRLASRLFQLLFLDSEDRSLSGVSGFAFNSEHPSRTPSKSGCTCT